MRQGEIETIERELLEDRGKYYRGTARVRFEHLHFGNLCPRGRDEKIVEYLKDKFSHACLRLEPINRIPAVIDAHTLDVAIESSPEVTQNSLLNNPKGLPPELKFPSDCHVECLHGRQRFEAAKEVLPRKDRWWTIDLYLKGASSALLTDLSQEYSDSINFSDGEVYQKIYQYKGGSDQFPSAMFTEKRLWSRLTKSKRRDLKQFLKNGPLNAGFDALRVIPGLWGGFRIGHKFMALKCDEEILHYLGYIMQVWSAILGGNQELMRMTDQGTVDTLQLRAPGLSQEDLAALETPFHTRKLFPAVMSPKHRQDIWNNLRNEKRLIPTMWSLFEDIKFLRGPAKIMRQLFVKSSLTVFQAMEEIFTACNQKTDMVVFQDSERSFRSEKFPSVNQAKFGYWQLWLYTWRHFTRLGQGCPRKEDGEDTPVPEDPNPTIWNWLGSLADKLGFESDQIHELMTLDPDRELARKSLLMGRCAQYFQYDKADFESFQSQISAMYKTAKSTAPPGAKPPLLVDGPGEALERRCGRTFRRAYEYDRDFLFLDALFDPSLGEGRGISSFYVRASVFWAFFGNYMPSNSSDTALSHRTGTQSLNANVEDEAASHTSEINLQALTSTEAAIPLDRQTAPIPIEEEARTLGNLSDVDLVAVNKNVEPPTDLSTMRPPSEDEQMGELHSVAENPFPRLNIMIFRDGVLNDQRDSIPMERSEVERFANKQIRKNIIPVNENGRALAAKKCFDAILSEGRRTITLVPYNEFPIAHPQIASFGYQYQFDASNKENQPKKKTTASPIKD